MEANAPYTGYLVPFVGLIRAMHERGASTMATAIALYDAGARAHTSDPSHAPGMTRQDHCRNLRAMVIYAQRRMGLRVRRVRVLTLKATEVLSGAENPAEAVYHHFSGDAVCAPSQAVARPLIARMGRGGK
jgi:hypothetical protein